MIPAYDAKDILGDKMSKEQINHYGKYSTISEDPELIRRVMNNWVQYKNIEFVDMIILTNLINDEQWLNKIALVNDLSYRNCCIYFGFDKISRVCANREIGDKSLEEAFSVWEKEGVEKIFILVDGWEHLQHENPNWLSLYKERREVELEHIIMGRSFI